jgi:hypothetical protein
VELASVEASGAPPAPQIVTLPWSKKPFREAKGITNGGPLVETRPDPKAAQVLAAVARARQWVDQLMSGASLAEIAQQEGKGERQTRHLMPLAFVPPTMVRRIIVGQSTHTITDLARQVPITWT